MKDSDTNQTLDPDLLMRLLEAGETVAPSEAARKRMRADVLKRSRIHAPVPDGSNGSHASEVPDALVTVRPDDLAQWQEIKPGLAKQFFFNAGCSHSHVELAIFGEQRGQ